MESLIESVNMLIAWLADIKKVCPNCNGSGKEECSCDKDTRIRDCYYRRNFR